MTELSNPIQQMTSMVTSHWAPQVIRAAVDLSLPEHLATEDLTAAEIAQREGSAPATTFRLMRACVVIGLLTADKQGRFHGTPLLATLRKNTAGSLRGMALATTASGNWLSWSQFTKSVRAGRTQAAAVLGADLFTYMDQHPDDAREFSDGLADLTALWTGAAAEVIDTTGVKVAADIGGNNGSLLHVLLKANSKLHGIIFDRPGIVPLAKKETERQGLEDRTEVIGGDFFDSVPPSDLQLLKMIMHDWDDESCVKILNNARKTLKPGGRIAVVEMLVGELDDPGWAAMMDMNMLAAVPGQERSLAEYDALLSAAGLRRTDVIPTGAGQSVIFAQPSK